MKGRTLHDSSSIYICYKCDANMIIESLSSGGKFEFCLFGICNSPHHLSISVKIIGIHWYKDEPENIREYKLTNKARREFLKTLRTL